jgi:hypothetical protein
VQSGSSRGGRLCLVPGRRALHDSLENTVEASTGFTSRILSTIINTLY